MRMTVSSKKRSVTRPGVTATARRKFILADTPGHEQYTRNMATGASTADLAILLVDARHGVREQTRRHARIARLLGISRQTLYSRLKNHGLFEK